MAFLSRSRQPPTSRSTGPAVNWTATLLSTIIQSVVFRSMIGVAMGLSSMTLEAAGECRVFSRPFVDAYGSKSGLGMPSRGRTIISRFGFGPGLIRPFQMRLGMAQGGQPAVLGSYLLSSFCHAVLDCSPRVFPLPISLQLRSVALKRSSRIKIS